MNLEIINKWLENEFGVSYTRLEELHDFVVEQDLKHQEEKDKLIKDLQKKAELGEHYKHLYSEIKKQKDDVVEYIKTTKLIDYDNDEVDMLKDTYVGEDLLRMLGEIDVED